MILGVGTDIVDVGRIRNSIEKLGEAFIHKLLLPEEWAYCQAYRYSHPHVAARFAAKEALSKAFGTGIGARIGWHDIEVCRRESGEPYLVLHGGAKELADTRKVDRIHLSLSHTKEYATAVVVLESRE